MTTEQQLEVLRTITTRNEAGRHFTELVESELLDDLESQGLIETHRPIHDATGIPYDSQYWSVEVTDSGLSLINAN